MFLVEGHHMGSTLARLGCPQERIRVQHLGVDLQRIAYRPPDARAEGPPVVLMYAAFREKKGHTYGLRAFAQVSGAFPRAELRLVGDGPLRERIEREVVQLGLRDRASFLGMLPHGRSLEELGRATVLLYPSVTASDGDTEGGAPVGLIEAMASGLPVVSSRHADIPEVVPEGACGILADEGDVDGLAEGLDSVLRSEEKRACLSEAARRHVEENHNLAVQARELERIYDGLVGS